MVRQPGAGAEVAGARVPVAGRRQGAQSTPSNPFAGLQIAFGDTVVVDGEWGTVDEVTLAYLTVRAWDERRITKDADDIWTVRVTVREQMIR